MRTLRLIFLFGCLLLPLSGCNLLGNMLEGHNSDREHGAGYARVPQKDADGEMYVPERDWSAGPERVW